MNARLRRLRRFLAGDPPRRPHDFTHDTARFATAQTVIRCFYGFLLYLAVSSFGEFEGLLSRETFSPLWPVTWLPATAHPESAAKGLLAFYTAGSFLAAVWPGSRLIRIVAWAGLLEFVALKYSFGKIGHSLHLLVLVALLLIFLPDRWQAAARQADRRLRQSTLLVFWTCQAAILLTYTMSGLGKLGGALYQIALRQPNAFLPGALGAHIAQRLLQTNSTSALGAWIIVHPWLTWPLMPGPIYLELCSFWIAFRPPLQRFWAGTLIFFHLATFFTMTISFPQSCFLLAIFFFPPVWQQSKTGWRENFFTIPLFGFMFRPRSLGRAGPPA